LQIQASSFNSTAGLETRDDDRHQGGYDVGYADNGDYAVYQNVNFGAGFTNLNVREASFGAGTLVLHPRQPNRPIISSFALTSTGGWQTWQTLHESVSGATGLHNLYVVFQGSMALKPELVSVWRGVAAGRAGRIDGDSGRPHRWH